MWNFQLFFLISLSYFQLKDAFQEEQIQKVIKFRKEENASPL